MYNYVEITIYGFCSKQTIMKGTLGTFFRENEELTLMTSSNHLWTAEGKKRSTSVVGCCWEKKLIASANCVEADEPETIVAISFPSISDKWRAPGLISWALDHWPFEKPKCSAFLLYSLSRSTQSGIIIRTSNWQVLLPKEHQNGHLCFSLIYLASWYAYLICGATHSWCSFLMIKYDN